MRRRRVPFLLGMLLAMAAPPVLADALDDIINAGRLRCGVMLDFPPAGFRDTENRPAGFDVDYCRDIAAALGVEAEIVETPAPQRIPALVSGQVDIGIGSITATTERAKTVLFTNPYMAYKLWVGVRRGSGIDSWEKVRGLTVGVVRGTTPELEYLERCRAWPEGCRNISYGSNGEQVLAFLQGKVDAIIEADAFLSELRRTEQGRDLEICCEVPGYTDWVAIAVPRGEFGLRDWLNLFIFWQVDSGRFAELYQRWFGREPPKLRRDDVEY